MTKNLPRHKMKAMYTYVAYLLDVSGHGVPAALLSVTVTRSLHHSAGNAVSLVAGIGANPDAVEPAKVASRLNVL